MQHKYRSFFHLFRLTSISYSLWVEMENGIGFRDFKTKNDYFSFMSNFGKKSPFFLPVSVCAK